MLTAENITKKFSGVTALDKVCITLEPGKVNAIIGENGAGKSTLMKILSGVYTDYSGEIIYKNQPVRFRNTSHAQSAGIAIIHQELNLIPYLSITENIFLGRELTGPGGILRHREMRKQTVKILDKLQLRADPDTLVGVLKVGQQQVVEIAKALVFESEVIIMDEPTSAISESEVDVLFRIIDQLRGENKIIVYISHKLDELFRIADRYIVLRDGKSIESGDMAGMTHEHIIRKMVGRDIHLVRRQDPQINKSTPLLSLENIRLRHPVRRDAFLVKDISFNVYKGEVLGIFGLMGAGRTELLETIFGMHPGRSAGRVIVGDTPLLARRPSDAIDAGLALVPEDRKKDGLITDLSVRFNISLPALDEVSTAGFLSHRKEDALAEKYIDELSVKAFSGNQAVKTLSGGNQQKIVLAKWLARKPKVLLLDEPTRGIDIHAKNEIYKLILQLADAGLGIVMVSSELPEILGICDRIIVMSEGRITAEFGAENASENAILTAAIPTSL